MRTFIVNSTDNFLHNESISAGVEYTLNSLADTVYFCRNQSEVSCSYMPLHKFKRALREGIITFTDVTPMAVDVRPAALRNNLLVTTVANAT